MAHRWAIDEIVRGIVSSLVRESDNRASAVALASCSKSLEEPALGEFGGVFPASYPWLDVFLLTIGKSEAGNDTWQVQRVRKT